MYVVSGVGLLRRFPPGCVGLAVEQAGRKKMRYKGKNADKSGGSVDLGESTIKSPPVACEFLPDLSARPTVCVNIEESTKSAI